MQLHIRHKNRETEAVQQHGYSPMHEARPLDEFEENDVQTSADTSESETDEHIDTRYTAKKALMFILGAIMLFGGITYFAGVFTSESSLANVRVEGNHSLLTKEILQLAKVDTMQKFYDIDLGVIADRVEKHPLVRSAVLRREINPNTIVIAVNEREPVALVRTASGEPALIDEENKLFWPKRITGLRNPERLMAVPVLSGISENDSLALPFLTWLVRRLDVMSDSAMSGDIAEVKRTPTGAYVLYTNETMTPIFLGSSRDENFLTSLENEQLTAADKKPVKSLFERQLELLAELWKKKLKQELRTSHTMYVDARFDGQIIVKRRS